MAAGARAWVSQPGLGTKLWTITRLDPPNVLAWETRLGTVRVKATRLLEPEAAGCHSTLVLTLKGPGAGLLGRLIGQRMQTALEKENAGPKAGAEQQDEPA